MEARMETGRMTIDDFGDPNDFSGERLEGALLMLEKERDKRDAAKKAEAGEPVAKPYKRAPQLVEAILARARDPWVSLNIGGDTLARVRVGSTVVIIGGSGSGKSSLTLELCGEHAEMVGPAIVLSIELPEEEAGARIVGQKCDASWEDALTGKVPVEAMERALSCDRLFILDRRRATLKNLEIAVDDARAEFPGQPILVAIDYAQLMESKEREARQKVADIFAQIDDCAREKKFVALALSQMSRENARKARSGEAIGADSSDLGAEAAAIERFATLTLAIGKANEREDGSAAVELSVGKARMGKGDRVFPMTYVGYSGRWRVAGDAQRADVVREKRVTERAHKEEKTIEAALVAFADQSASPLSKAELRKLVHAKTSRVVAAIQRLLHKTEDRDALLVEVDRRAKGARKTDWMVWTPGRAKAAGVPTVADVANGLFAQADGGVE
jgi:hypothetical protein